MSPAPPEPDRWESCPSDAFVRTVRRIQARHRAWRRVKLLGRAGTAVVLLLAATLIVQQFGPEPAAVPQVGKMTCAAARSLLPAYLAGKLEAAVAGQLESHLKRCPHCRDRYEKAKDETASRRPANRARPLAWSCKGTNLGQGQA